MLQALVEKHFPAPDRQKLYSLLGIDLPVKKAPAPSVNTAATEQKGKKRKGNRSLKLVCNRRNALNWPFVLYYGHHQLLTLRSSRRRNPASTAASRVPARMSQRTRTRSLTVTTASNLSALPMRMMISTHSEMSLMMMTKAVRFVS